MNKPNILLNPGPANTSDLVKKALIVDDICPREEAFGILIGTIREKVLKVVNADSTHEAVLFGGSGTAAVEAAISSLVGPKDKILILDNGAYGRRAETIAGIYGLNTQIIKLNWGEFPNLAQVEEIIKYTDGLSHFFFVHHETTTGMLNPLAGLIDLCLKYNLISIVDAMSSYAGIPIDLSITKVDFLISSSNKCIQGFAGVGIVIAHIDKLMESRKVPPKNLYLNLFKTYEYLNNNHQFPFTPPVQVLYALNVALDEFFIETMQGRHARYSAMYDTLIQGLRDLSLECLLPIEQHSKLLTAILEPTHKDYSFNNMHDYLFERGVTIYPGKGATKKTFRIANIGNINPKDITFALGLLKEYLDTLK